MITSFFGLGKVFSSVSFSIASYKQEMRIAQVTFGEKPQNENKQVKETT